MSHMKVSVNRWIVFNWNAFNGLVKTLAQAVSVNRWIVFNWNVQWILLILPSVLFQLIVG